MLDLKKFYETAVHSQLELLVEPLVAALWWWISWTDSTFPARLRYTVLAMVELRRSADAEDGDVERKAAAAREDDDRE